MRRMSRRRRRRGGGGGGGVGLLVLSPLAKSIFLARGGNTEINTEKDIKQSIWQKNLLGLNHAIGARSVETKYGLESRDWRSFGLWARIARLAFVRLKHNMGSNLAVGVRGVFGDFFGPCWFRTIVVILVAVHVLMRGFKVGPPESPKR